MNSKELSRKNKQNEVNGFIKVKNLLKPLRKSSSVPSLQTTEAEFQRYTDHDFDEHEVSIQIVI